MKKIKLENFSKTYDACPYLVKDNVIDFQLKKFEKILSTLPNLKLIKFNDFIK